MNAQPTEPQSGDTTTAKAEVAITVAGWEALEGRRLVEATAREARKAIGLLTEEETAAVLLLNSVGTLATWRSQKTGPQSLKLGKRVFYTINQLGTWMNEVAAKQAAA